MTAPTPDFDRSSGDRPAEDRPAAIPSAEEAWISVKEVMAPPGATVPASASVWRAIDALLEGNHDRVWLTDPEGKLAGEVTGVALLWAEIRGVPGERPVMTLSDPVEPLNEQDDSAAAVVRLSRGEVGRLPVTRDGVLVGELGRNDVLSLVNGVRRVAAVAGVPQPAPSRESRPSVGPGAPRFLSRQSKARARYGDS